MSLRPTLLALALVVSGCGAPARQPPGPPLPTVPDAVGAASPLAELVPVATGAGRALVWLEQPKADWPATVSPRDGHPHVLRGLPAQRAPLAAGIGPGPDGHPLVVVSTCTEGTSRCGLELLRSSGAPPRPLPATIVRLRPEG